MMNSLKMSLLALSMSLSVGVMAATTMDSTTGSEADLNRPNSSGTPNIQDCSIRNGNDKVLCEKQMQNDAARPLPNDNGRTNRNNDANMIDDRKSRDLQSRDREINNSQRLDSQGLGTKPNDSQPRDTTPISSNPSSSGNDGSGITP